MSWRKKFVKSLRTSFASVALAGAAATIPLTAGIVGYDNAVADFDNTTNAVSTNHYQQYAAEVIKLKRFLEEREALGEAAEDQNTPEAVKQFVAARHEIEDKYIATAHHLSANILTDKELTEKDYEVLSEQFHRLKDGELDYKSYQLPREPHVLDESQETVSGGKAFQDKLDQAKQVRHEMKNATGKLDGALIIVFSLIAAGGLAGGVGAVRPERMLANRIEKGGFAKNTPKRN